VHLRHQLDILYDGTAYVVSQLGAQIAFIPLFGGFIETLGHKISFRRSLVPVCDSFADERLTAPPA